MTKNLSIQDLSKWSNADITAGIMRQQRTIAACLLADEALKGIAGLLEATGGRNPIKTVAMLRADSVKRGATLTAEACTRGMIPALMAEGIFPPANGIKSVLESLIKEA